MPVNNPNEQGLNVGDPNKNEKATGIIEPTKHRLRPEYRVITNLDEIDKYPYTKGIIKEIDRASVEGKYIFGYPYPNPDWASYPDIPEGNVVVARYDAQIDRGSALCPDLESIKDLLKYCKYYGGVVFMWLSVPRDLIITAASKNTS